jgi:hypothetical protein
MRFQDVASPQITVDEPIVLVVALYVRDVCGIVQSVPPVDLPPLSPALQPSAPALALDPDALRDAAAQWAAWWSASLPTGGDIALLHPGQPVIDDAPELTVVLRHYGAVALQWARQRHREHADAVVNGRLGHITPLIHDLERSMRRRPLPFTLRITELPVAGKRSWRVARDHVVVSRSLLEHPEHFVTMIEPVLESLA